jgi:hypothetical protein
LQQTECSEGSSSATLHLFSKLKSQITTRNDLKSYDPIANCLDYFFFAEGSHVESRGDDLFVVIFLFFASRGELINLLAMDHTT